MILLFYCVGIAGLLLLVVIILMILAIIGIVLKNYRGIYYTLYCSYAILKSKSDAYLCTFCDALEITFRLLFVSFQVW